MKYGFICFGLFVVMASAACGGGDDGSGGSITTSTTSSTSVLTCPTKCALPEICGYGCGVTPGCYTPGGNPTNPGPNDCPSCFAAPEATAVCDANGFTTPYRCQPDAMPLGGCKPATSNGIQCCPPLDGGP